MTSDHDICMMMSLFIGPEILNKAAIFYCVQDHFEPLEMFRQDRNASRYGFWRPHAIEVIYRYLACGHLRFGFVWVKCQACGHECLLACFCMSCHLCPYGHQKQLAQSGERLIGCNPLHIIFELAGKQQPIGNKQLFITQATLSMRNLF